MYNYMPPPHTNEIGRTVLKAECVRRERHTQKKKHNNNNSAISITDFGRQHTHKV